MCFEDACDERGGAASVDQGRERDAPAVRFDDVPAHDLFLRVVGPFHQHVGPDGFDELDRRGLVEPDEVVDALELGQHAHAVVFVDDGPFVSLETTNPRVGVYADHQQVSLRFGELEWKGYRTEIEVINKPKLGYAPDGVPFSWLYTPYEDTQVCRTTDFGVIHHGNSYDQPSVLLKELPDNSVKMYPVWWEGEKFEKYLSEAAKIKGFIPIGRLGMYKYVTMDSTYGMVQRLCKGLSRYAEADHAGRLDCLKHVRGDWAN